jgi:hypothetical protein
MKYQMIRQQIINPFEYWSGGRGEPFSIQFNFLSESGNELQVFFYLLMWVSRLACVYLD